MAQPSPTPTAKNPWLVPMVFSLGLLLTLLHLTIGNRPLPAHLARLRASVVEATCPAHLAGCWSAVSSAANFVWQSRLVTCCPGTAVWNSCSRK